MAKTCSLHEEFRLEGEAIVRVSSGQVVPCTPSKKDGYARVNVLGPPRSTLLYHRLKFYLAHGHLPDFVDHRDKNRGNCLLDNLREATRVQNAYNRGQRPKAHGITSRGVFYRKDCPASPYQAQITLPSGKRSTLGYFATEDAASTVVEAALRQQHGEFYRG